MKKYIHAATVIAALGLLASCSSATKVQQPKPAPQAVRASAPKTVEAPSNIDNMVYKERGEVVYVTGRRSAWDQYHSDDGTYFGPSPGLYDLAYKKTGAKTAQISWARGHRESSTYLRFTTPTSGYVYREEYISREGVSDSNKRIPFTLERR